MKWDYKGIKITISKDGNFYFKVNKITSCECSLELAKRKIDTLLKKYYTFNENDINILCKKLNKRETEFVKALISEVEVIGIADEIACKFKLEYNE